MEEAELYAARGVVADRTRSLLLSRVWNNMGDRLQGSDRSWLESRRQDPAYGVKVPGNMSIPRSLTEP